MIDTTELEDGQPISLKGYIMAIVVRITPKEIGVQVPGEDQIRWIKAENVKDIGGGALKEI